MADKELLAPTDARSDEETAAMGAEPRPGFAYEEGPDMEQPLETAGNAREPGVNNDRDEPA